MKRIIAAGILLVFSVVMSVLSLNVTGRIAENIAGSAEEIERTIDSKGEGALEKTRQLVEDWENNYKILSTYISHQHLEEVENHVAILEKYAEAGNFDAAGVICFEIAKSIRHIYTSEKPKIQNIF